MSTKTTWKHFPLENGLRKSLKQNLFDKPLPIQSKALKATIIDDKHVLGAAKTGSGKTLAYAIPIINHILAHRGASLALKRRITKQIKKQEDFELADGDLVSIEDMVVDKELSSDESEYYDSKENIDSASDCNNDSDESEQETEDDISSPEAVILVPTRELASQVKEELDKLCKDLDIKTLCIIGGLNQDKQARKLRQLKPEIIIGTPGRLYDIVQSETIPHLNVHSISSIKTLVVDEADRMVEKGHFQEMMKLIEILVASKEFRKQAHEAYRVYLFSATLTFLHEVPERVRKDADLAKKFRHSKKDKLKGFLSILGLDRSETRIIDLTDALTCGRPSSDQLEERKVNCVQADKDLYLYYFLYQNPGKRSLVFCNSKDCLRRLANVLKFLEIKVLTLHAEMDQKKRLSSLEKFRQSPDSVMIATDVAARGLDIKELDCVVHYQVPRTCESYIHRSGRTARLFRKGISLTLCEPKEVFLYKRLCNNINGEKDIENYDIDLNLKNALQQRVTLAQACDKLDHQLRECKSNENWFTKAAKQCDIELDEDELRRLSGKGRSRQENVEMDAEKRRKLSHMTKNLKALLKRPIYLRPK